MPTRMPPRTGRDLHRAWLELVDSEGPFLALPALLRVWPQGMPPVTVEAKASLVDAKPAFDRAWDDWDRHRDHDGTFTAYRSARDAWVDVVLRDLLGWGQMWQPGDSAAAQARISAPDHSVTVQPTGVLRHGDHLGALVWVIDPVASLRDLSDDAWASNPIDRIEQMLRDSGIPVGVVTDGRWWGLVSAASRSLAASGVVDAQTWVEEGAVRDAFAAVLGLKALVGGSERDRLPALFAESVLAAEEVTEALGVQVRKAVELVVQAFSEGSSQARQRGEADPLPDDGEVVYEAVVTVLMRIVFLLFAEERGLLPQGELFERGYGLTGQLDALDGRARAEGEDALDGTYGVWHRLLATSQALYHGASFEDMRLPAYGGSLFDPDRFPFLTATTARGTLALSVSDRVMWHVLQSVQTAKVKGQPARRLSFRDIDVEQIGYIYEGLLGYTCAVADQVVVGLIGKDAEEPEIPLDLLDNLYEEHGDDAGTAAVVIDWVKDDQPASKPPSTAALTRAFASGDEMADAERALHAVSSDEGLREQLRPWLGAVRRDLRGWPVVTLPGGLFIKETPSRRNAGAHYTPRALAEEVVEHALQPIVYSPGPHQTPDRDAWRLKSSTELLSLKVADIACGSGAFLVAAARYLAARLVEAWRAEHTTAELTPRELETKALREVVARCLYGADINGMAVEMCKLSLWLVSLDRDLPFSFVDDKVLRGNSLLGITSLRQLEELHIDPSITPRQGELVLAGNELVDRMDIDHRIQRAISLRRQLATEIDDRDPQRTAHAKRGQLSQFQAVTKDLHRVADGVVAAGLRVGGKPGRALNEAYENLRSAVRQAVPEDPTHADPRPLDAIIEAGLTPTVETDYARWQPMHWALEVPDVMVRGGFDAVIGNPPFLGFKDITPSIGKNMRDWMAGVVAGQTGGKSDLVAYFVRRAASLTNSNGTMSLIATNTLPEGDTREVAMDPLLRGNWTIYRAIRSRPWPTRLGIAHSIVWMTRSQSHGPYWVDGVAATRIGPMLEPALKQSHPRRLLANGGIAFQGSIPGGNGLLVSQATAKAWIAADPSNSRVLRPLLRGKDVTDRPDLSPTLWVIDFQDFGIDQARTYAGPFQHAQYYSKPARAHEKVASRRDQWWLFSQWGKSWRSAVQKHESMLVLPITTKTGVPARVSSSVVPSNGLEVFLESGFHVQGVLSSCAHSIWSLTFGSTLETRPRYSISDVFETFPRPQRSSGVRESGKVLDEERREIMLRRELGLTKIYNLVNDPDISGSADPDVARLRQIHVDLDHAVMAAYGWDDVPLDHGFHTYRQMQRWTVSPAARVEMLDRLLEENHRRAALQSGAPPATDETGEEGDE